MAALPQCDAFGFIYDPDGTPDVDKLVVVLNVIDPSGSSISFEQRHTFTDDLGQFRFTLPQGSTAYIQARASGFWADNGPVPFAVPNSPSGELLPTVVPQEIVGVTPPLVLDGSTLTITRATTTQDGYLAAEDFALFTQGAAMDTIPGVAGTWPNPTSITVNAYGQIISITSGAPDTTPPVISAISTSALTGTSVTVTWTTNEPADSQVEYGLTTSYGTSTTLNTSPVTSHSVPITGLTASTLYHYRVKSKDTAGNLTTSGDNTFTTTAVVDTTPPVISAVTATAITESGATITWTTDEASDSQVEYGLTTSYGSSTTLNTAMVTSHSVPISGTAASTLYHYRVKSRNAASLLQTSGDNTFTTTAAVAVDLLTDLKSMWKLDEPGDFDLRADSGPSGNTLTNSGAVSSAAGKIGNAAHFIGDGNILNILHNATLSTGDIDYTIALWGKLDSKATDGDFAGKNEANGIYDEYIVGYGPAPDDKFRFTVCGGPSHNYTSIFATDPGSPTTGVWYFIVCWHEMSSGTINIQIGTGTTLGTVNTTVRAEPMNAATSPFHLGAFGLVGSASNLLHGSVDECAFWQNRVLDSAAITALWNGGAGKPFSTWT